jgi:Na+-driven multidrug efflux pump
MLYLQDQINLVFVGSLGDTHQLAAVGLGNMVMMLLPYSIMIGVNTALETFVAQAFGSNNLK